ncbi:MAG TPA: MotA/TolQ/ExbB proton channel family protein, partial [Nannocystis sp.]
SLFEIWESMSLLSRLVALALLGMGVASFAVIIERAWILRRIRRESFDFAGRSRPLFLDGDEDAILDLARRFPQSPLARLTAIGIQTFQAHEKGSRDHATELTRRELARKLELYSADARRGMGLLASIGSTAPFLGLFGTVIGIIVAFQGIASAGGGGIAAVSAGIAEALIVTAVGLIVAITSVLFFNYLSGKFDRLDMQMQHAAGELVDYLEGAHGHRGHDR